jgi:hypothetical protein
VLIMIWKPRGLIASREPSLLLGEGPARPPHELAKAMQAAVVQSKVRA